MQNHPYQICRRYNTDQRTNKEYLSVGLNILTPSSIKITRLTPLFCSASQSSHLRMSLMTHPGSQKSSQQYEASRTKSLLVLMESLQRL